MTATTTGPRAAAPARHAPVAARALVVLAVVVLAADAGLVVALHGHRGDAEFYVPDLVSGLAWPLLAALVLRRDPRHRLGWLLMVIGVTIALHLALSDLAVWLRARGHGSAWLDWAGFEMGEVGWPFLWLVPQVFPDGRPLSSRWRPLVWLTGGFFAAATVASALRPQRLPTGVDSPVGVDWVSHLDPLPLRGAWLLLLLAGLVSLVLRLRRGNAVQRAQLRAFLLAMALLAPVLALGGHLRHGWVLVAAATLLLPAAMTSAILRHRLYEVDRLVSRTVSYVLLSAVLAGVYVAAVTVVSRLVPGRSALAVALATLCAAAVTQPLRRRLQGVVDRRFDRARYDAQRVVDAFGARLRHEVSVDAVRGELLVTVHRALAPAGASLWLRPAAREDVLGD